MSSVSQNEWGTCRSAKQPNVKGLIRRNVFWTEDTKVKSLFCIFFNFGGDGREQCAQLTMAFNPNFRSSRVKPFQYATRTSWWKPAKLVPVETVTPTADLARKRHLGAFFHQLVCTHADVILNQCHLFADYYFFVHKKIVPVSWKHLFFSKPTLHNSKSELQSLSSLPSLRNPMGDARDQAGSRLGRVKAG